MKKIFLINTVWAAALIAISSASAVIVQPDEPVSADAMIYEFLPTTPLAAAFINVLPAASTTIGHDLASLIRFDLSSLTNDPIDSATLNLYVGDITTAGFPATNPDAAHPVIIEVHANHASFAEATATWGNAPAFGAIVDSLSIDAINQWVSFDVTSLVASWLASPATNYGIRMTGDGTLVQTEDGVVSVGFESANTANKPYLDIAYIECVLGDTDGDLDVDFDDFLAVQNFFGDAGPGSPGDADCDGDCDFDDFLAVNNFFGTQPPVLNAVPEPASLMLLALGGSVMLRRRAH